MNYWIMKYMNYHRKAFSSFGETFQSVDIYLIQHWKKITRFNVNGSEEGADNACYTDMLYSPPTMGSGLFNRRAIDIVVKYLIVHGNELNVRSVTSVAIEKLLLILVAIKYKLSYTWPYEEMAFRY